TGLYGEFLQDAQGEDVVAGIRTPINLDEMHLVTLEGEPGDGCEGVWPNIYAELEQLSERLEAEYRDMVDIEFTVQKGKLWVLQSRVGKRSALAAFKIAADLVKEGVI